MRVGSKDPIRPQFIRKATRTGGRVEVLSDRFQQAATNPDEKKSKLRRRLRDYKIKSTKLAQA